MNKYPLKFEPALKYVSERLQDGNTLALELLKTLNFRSGHFFALFQSSLVDKTRIHEFSAGGLLPENALELVSFQKKTYSGRKKSHSFHQLSLYLNSELLSGKCCYFEDVIYKNTDQTAPWAEKFIASFQDEVYLCLKKSEFSIELAEKMIHHSNAQWYYMNIISDDLGVEKHITSDQLQQIASGTSHLVLGAYDMEGFVVWEKTQ